MSLSHNKQIVGCARHGWNVLGGCVFFLVTLVAAQCLAGPNDLPRIGLIYNAKQYGKLKSGKSDDQKRYRVAIEAAGGKAMILSPCENPVLTTLKLKYFEGLLIPGGADVNPSRYGETPDPKLEEVDDQLDGFEFDLIRICRERARPMLGICRGEQILNVAFGGSLYQDIPTGYSGTKPTLHRIKKDGKAEDCFHSLILDDGCLVRELLGTSTIRVNSYHHQGVKAPGPGLTITGRSEDGFVEVMEASEPFIVAVQFHPEILRKTELRFESLFQAFIKATKTRPHE